MSQWPGDVATPWTNTNDSCWNETRSCQNDAFLYITRSYKRSCWELEQNNKEFLYWPPCPRIFRIASGYLLQSLIFPHSLRTFKDFGMQITNTVTEYCCPRENIYLSEVSTFTYLVRAMVQPLEIYLFIQIWPFYY